MKDNKPIDGAEYITLEDAKRLKLPYFEGLVAGFPSPAGGYPRERHRVDGLLRHAARLGVGKVRPCQPLKSSSPGGCDIYDKVPPDLSQNSGRVATTSGKKCQNFWNEADYFITLRQN